MSAKSFVHVVTEAEVADVMLERRTNCKSGLIGSARGNYRDGFLYGFLSLYLRNKP